MLPAGVAGTNGGRKGTRATSAVLDGLSSPDVQLRHVQAAEAVTPRCCGSTDESISESRFLFSELEQLRLFGKKLRQTLMVTAD
jgi:hypothetical protein